MRPSPQNIAIILCLMLSACIAKPTHYHYTPRNEDQPSTLTGGYILNTEQSILQKMTSSLAFWDKEAQKDIAQEKLGFIYIQAIDDMDTVQLNYTPKTVKELRALVEKSYWLRPGLRKITVVSNYPFRNIGTRIYHFDLYVHRNESYTIQGLGSTRSYRMLVKNRYGKEVDITD